MRYLLAVLFILAVSLQPCQAAEYYSGHAYDLIFQQLSWPDAKVAAVLLTPPAGYGPGHLTTISDQAENDFLTAAFGSSIPYGENDGAWAGMTDELVEGEWRWIDDTPGIWQDPHFFATPIQTAYVSWTGGEPNNTHGNEDHLSIRDTGNFNHYDDLTRNDICYLVEFEPVPEPSTMVMLVLGFTSLTVRRYGWRRTRGFDVGNLRIK